ncbi:MAG: alkyl hydroperoxide reductase/Thiol specific antioxidant/Mal allergen [Chitinophagaceae bacterium]|nr:alkyl hydroperoxide reductase/Thiol specific antioxidant/Mal allergen [Chitinophagaceae bacterium]
MRLTEKSPAPSIETTDVYGNSFSLTSLKGSKVLLSFMRFAGCPVCNLRVHGLLKESKTLEQQNTKVVLVYESSKETMLEYLQQEKYPVTFIADPENKLYKAYGVEKSLFGLLSSFFRGAMGKIIKGEKLFAKKLAMDGSVLRMGADFIIDENGKIVTTHYSRFMGDDLPLNQILRK